MRTDRLTSRPEPCARRGFALVMALLAILCLGAVLIPLAFTAREDHSLSRANRDAHRAFAAAELAAWRALAVFDSSHLDMLRGAALPVAVNVESVDSAAGMIVRLGDRVFLATGEAAVRGDGEPVRRRVGLLALAARDSAGSTVVSLLPGRHWLELH